ncbi:MAG: pyridoxal phosphate-dependent aminotransferase [Planctomycetes bacterium]|nr:pyridoxal phosphate-dependent aminotransferase [Planctomycetota bacterium]
MSRFLSQRILDQQQSAIRKYSAWVQRIGGVNLSQGVCDQPAPDILKQAAKQAIDDDKSIYTHMQGIHSVREAIAEKLKKFNHITADPETEIAVTIGSAGAFASLCEATLDPGDNVVTFSPYYSYHTNFIKLLGNETRFVEMHPPQWQFDRDELSRAIDGNTKMLLVCTPSNPTGKVFDRDELEFIIELAEKHDCLVVTDEVYEYIVHDKPHISAAALPGAKERTVTISGGSKTYAITGWRIGYLAGPAEIVAKAALAHDLLGICAPSCLQLGVEAAIRLLPDSYYSDMERDYRTKRDLLCETLQKIGMEPYRPDGAFYMMVNFHDMFENDTYAAEAILERVGVATVPGSIFHARPDQGRTQLRFCYAKKMPELEEGCERLLKLA